MLAREIWFKLPIDLLCGVALEHLETRQTPAKRQTRPNRVLQVRSIAAVFARHGSVPGRLHLRFTSALEYA